VPRLRIDTPEYAFGVAISGNIAYVADTSSLRVVDISNPSSPVEVGFFETPSATYSVAVAGGNIYVADSVGGLFILHFTGEIPLTRIYLPIVTESSN